MRKIECEFEAEVLSAVIQSRWPERVDNELREHAAHCEICSDVAAVAGAIECSREESAACAPALPESGLVWWKAQMRARREAIERAGRPITTIQIAAFASAIGLMGACIGATSSWFQAGLKGAWAAVTGFDFHSAVPYVITLLESHALLAACMLAMIFVLPVAVYLAVGRD